jgi:hypothetical protein
VQLGEGWVNAVEERYLSFLLDGTTCTLDDAMSILWSTLGWINAELMCDERGLFPSTGEQLVVFLKRKWLSTHPEIDQALADFLLTEFHLPCECGGPVTEFICHTL